jgi:FtsZ-binding cell division protein ZapB
MFLDGDCIRITIRILQIKLHLLEEKKNMLTQTNKKTKQHSIIALDQNFATHM